MVATLGHSVADYSLYIVAKICVSWVIDTHKVFGFVLPDCPRLGCAIYLASTLD
jgi:hypothetical protein